MTISGDMRLGSRPTKFRPHFFKLFGGPEAAERFWVETSRQEGIGLDRFLPLEGGFADIIWRGLISGKVQDDLIVGIDFRHIPSLFDNGVRVEPGWGWSLPKYEGMGISRFVKKIVNLLERFGRNP